MHRRSAANAAVTLHRPEPSHPPSPVQSCTVYNSAPPRPGARTTARSLPDRQALALGYWPVRNGGWQIGLNIPRALGWKLRGIHPDGHVPSGVLRTIRTIDQFGCQPGRCVTISKPPLDRLPLSWSHWLTPRQLCDGFLRAVDGIGRGPNPFRGFDAHDIREAFLQEAFYQGPILTIRSGFVIWSEPELMRLAQRANPNLGVSCI